MRQKILALSLLLTLVLTSEYSKAQGGLTLEATQQMTSFQFLNSAGEKLNSDYQFIYSGAYEIGYRHVLDQGIILEGGLGMRNAGSTLFKDDVNYDWQLQYANVYIGGGYLYKMGLFNPYLTVSGYYAGLVKANQLIDNETFDILESGQLSSNDLGIVVCPGVQVDLSDAVSAFSEFKYLQGLKNVETDANQDATNVSFGLSIGLFFKIN